MNQFDVRCRQMAAQIGHARRSEVGQTRYHLTSPLYPKQPTGELTLRKVCVGPKH
jgi:hypothetical protein